MRIDAWLRVAVLVVGTAWLAAWPEPAQAQDRRNRIDVEKYLIEAQIDPDTQTLSANVQVQFAALDDYTSSLSFELNNALNVSRITDGAERAVPASRSIENFSLRLNLPEPIGKGQQGTLKFTYDGRLSGREDSPVYGVKFASIQPEYAYLLYPARWFPINEYTEDRYRAELRITVPAGYRVIASGLETLAPSAEGKVTYAFDFGQPSFPGSLAVVREEPIRIAAEGSTSAFFFRGELRNMVGAYAEEIGRVVSFLSGLFGLPPVRNLAVVETESGAPNGYAAPGILFLSPSSIGKQVNSRLLVNQITRQWFGALFSAATRNHLWITNGMARYAEVMWIEQTAGPEAMEAELRDNYVEALTIERPPLSQSARLEDYSPEFWASTAAKGSAVLNMLRYVIGEAPFRAALREFAEQNAWKSVSTDDFRRTAEAVSKRNLQGFFIQWIESSGAPRFDIEYTVYRTQKGFRVMGKISQDLDTFRMPVQLRIETEGNPEEAEVEVVGPSTEFVVEAFGRPKRVIVDPNSRVLRFDDKIHVAVAIRRGEMFAEIGEFPESLKEYQRALDVNRYSSLAHYRVAEVFFLQRNYQAAANEFREALNGDLEPRWTEVWSHITLGKIFDITGQRERAVNEYNLAIRTKDNTQGAQEEAARFLQQPYERPAEDY